MTAQQLSPEDFSKDILIIMTTYNRKKITELALKNIVETKKNATLWVIDDQSTEYDLDFLKSVVGDKAAKVEPNPERLNIERTRYRRQLEALETSFKYVYHTDNDAIHDPNWIERLQNITTAVPGHVVGLYNSPLHEQDTLQTIKEAALVVRRSCPGISYFFEQDLIRPAKPWLALFAQHPYVKAWDYVFSDLIKKPSLVSSVSFVEHYGKGGIHNQDFDRDKAVNPTMALAAGRLDILSQISE